MTPDQAWESNPIATSKILNILRDAADPEGAAKRNNEGWTRAEILDFRRAF